MNITIAYASVEGQSEKIAVRMASVLEQDGVRVLLVNTLETPDVRLAQDTDGLIVGGPLHREHHPQALEAWLVKEHENWSRLPVAFFSVSLSASSDRQQDLDDARRVMQNFLNKLRMDPVMSATIAGALKYSRYGFFKKRIMRNIVKKSGGKDLDMSRDYEYTNWRQVEGFARKFLERLRGEA